MIWDVHSHFPRDWEHPESSDYERLIDARADALRAAGITRASVLSGGPSMFGPSHEEALAHLRRHEDLMVPVATLPVDEAQRGEVERLNDLGYRGLKIIGSRHSIDDYRYFHIYAEAEARRMPILFHLGVIGGSVDYSRTHPRRDPEAAASLRRWQEMRGRLPRDVSAMRMRPFQLDTIANNFPELRLIGAHMGGTGNYEEAASVARWRPHVVFDLSGGETIENHAAERGLIGREIGVEKLVWGSDCGDAEIGEHVERLRRIFEDLGLSDDEVDRIWYRNAAELFGEAEPEFAGRVGPSSALQNLPRALQLDGPTSDAPAAERDHAQDAEPPGTVAPIAVAASSRNDPAEDEPRPREDLDHGEDPPEAEAPWPSVLPRPRPLIDGPTVVLSALVTLGFLMFLLIEPTQRWIALFGAAVAALGTEGVLRSARRRPIDLGLDPTPQLFLPALFALALPVFIEHNARGLWVPLAGLAAGAGFGALVTAEVHSVRAYEPRLASAKLVTSSAAYLAGFALYSLTYSFELDLVPAIAAAALISGLLSIELLRDAAAEPLDTLGFAAVSALVVGELRWALHFVPLDGHLAGLALLLGFFFVSGVLHAHLTRQLARAVLAEYTAIVAAGVVLVVAARAADLA